MLSLTRSSWYIHNVTRNPPAQDCFSATYNGAQRMCVVMCTTSSSTFASCRKADCEQNAIPLAVSRVPCAVFRPRQMESAWGLPDPGTCPRPALVVPSPTGNAQGQAPGTAFAHDMYKTITRMIFGRTGHLNLRCTLDNEFAVLLGETRTFCFWT